MSGTLIVICGPTASGKTKLALQVAKHFSAEIISADSRQVYKELKIGSAPPTDAELNEVKHHFIASRHLDDDYNAGAFEKDVLTLLDELFRKKKFAVLVGGSGLYIDAVCNGFDKVPSSFPEIRKALQDLYDGEGIQQLRAKLKVLDPDFYTKVDLNNPQRLMRALEVCMGTGKPYSTMREGKKNKRAFRIIKTGMDVKRDLLYKRIDGRVDEMMKAGLLQEAEELISKKHLNALQTVGYKELFDYLEGKTTLETAVDLIKQNSRRYAKRQLTWFRRDKEITWFAPDDLSGIIHFIESNS
ncbi:MAG: tRNA dimethylallyltransferase [Bacteroidia bacterium]|nr:tRNA dimethylallyltransferase [Bacteroidia bacterium]